jgi:hypothetical protein
MNIIFTEKSNKGRRKHIEKKIKQAEIQLSKLASGMILGAKFFSWAKFPWFFQKTNSLF